MTDEIRIYHVDDPNDAPNRRPGALPAINPFLQTPLPPFVIAPVADSLQHALSMYYINSAAYLHGMYQQHEHQQRQLQQLQHQQQLQQQQQIHHASATTYLQTLQPPPSSVRSSLSASIPTSNNDFLSSPDPSLAASTNRSQTQSNKSTLHHQHHLHLLNQHRRHLLHDQQQQQNNINSNLRPLNDSPQPPSAASTAQMASSSSASSSSSSIDSNSPQSTHFDHDHTSHHHRHHRSNSVSSVEQEQPHRKSNHEHIKKPLNPFMIFMQKQRPEIVRQGIIKESAAINQLLGQQWKKLSREEQEPYYKLAEEEKLLHAQKYPGWSARDNYANQKKRKKLKLKSISQNGLDQSDKKCRARFGVNNTASWCKPCRRKKKCIYSTPRHQDRTIIGNNNNLGNSDNMIGGSINENHNHLSTHHNPFHLAPPSTNHGLSFQF